MAGKGDRKGSGNAPEVVIKKEEIVEGGHHGGAWKVAYADFVTAMMAFFLLMWLLNATTEDQRKGLADYFSPNNLLSHASSGTGQPFGGHTAFDDGALVSDRGTVQITNGKRPVVATPDDGNVEVIADPHGLRPTDSVGKETGQDGDAATSDGAPGLAATGQSADRQLAAGELAERAGQAAGPPSAGADGAQAGGADGQSANGSVARERQAGPLAGTAIGTAGLLTANTITVLAGSRTPTAAEIRAEKERQEKAAFEQAAEQIRQAVKADPALADLARQLAIDMTPEGLRVQIIDEVRSPMFATGSAAPNDRARMLLQKVVPVLLRLKQAISIAGYTDAAPFPGPDRTNWELSAERANATRRLMVDAGLPDSRIRTVTGHADRDPLLPADPLAAANRRIAIVVLREASNNSVPSRP